MTTSHPNNAPDPDILKDLNLALLLRKLTAYFDQLEVSADFKAVLRDLTKVTSAVGSTVVAIGRKKPFGRPRNSDDLSRHPVRRRRGPDRHFDCRDHSVCRAATSRILRPDHARDRSDDGRFVRFSVLGVVDEGHSPAGAARSREGVTVDHGTI